MKPFAAAYTHELISDWWADVELWTQHSSTLTNSCFHPSRRWPPPPASLCPSLAAYIFLPLRFLRHRPFSLVFIPILCSCSVVENNSLFLSITKRNWSGNFPGDKSQLFRLPTTALNRWIFLVFLVLLSPPSSLPSGHPPPPTWTAEESLEQYKTCPVKLYFF